MLDMTDTEFLLIWSVFIMLWGLGLGYWWGYEKGKGRG